jgi:hypothetical protein
LKFFSFSHIKQIFNHVTRPLCFRVERDTTRVSVKGEIKHRITEGVTRFQGSSIRIVRDVSSRHGFASNGTMMSAKGTNHDQTSKPTIFADKLKIFLQINIRFNVMQVF